MATKGILITIFFLFFSVTFLSAQHTASATMKVSVRVIEGASVKISEASPTVINHEDCDGRIVNFANIKVAHSKGQNIRIERPSQVVLKNEYGDQLSFTQVPGDLEKYEDETGFHLSYSEQEHAIRGGAYKGSLKTSIIYN